MFWEAKKKVSLIDFRLFCTVSATPTNRASGAFRDGSSCATSGASILLIKLTYFEDPDSDPDPDPDPDPSGDQKQRRPEFLHTGPSYLEHK